MSLVQKTADRDRLTLDYGTDMTFADLMYANEEYDLIVAGCGFAGTIVAREKAKQGERVLLLERRGHIAGNMYDETDENGILIQRYGPHTFHTKDQKIADYIKTLWDWEPYILRVRTEVKGKLTPSPFNTDTIFSYYPKEKADAILDALRKTYPGRKSVTIVELLSSDVPLIREYAQFLFEEDYRPYTAKQWGIAPEDLDLSVLKRVPVRLDDTDAYFDDPCQVLPKGGYTKMFSSLLSDENITVVLNCDALNFLSVSEDGQLLWCGRDISIPVLWTGPLDELLKNRYGKLPYRSIFFDFKTIPEDSYQETQGVAYPKAEGYTRITEFKKIPCQDVPGVTTIAVEYPADYGTEKGKEPYYPILTDESAELYQKYCSCLEHTKNLYLCGRLAEFKYYNMDQVIVRALETVRQIP